MSSELLFIVDEENNPLEPRPRSEAIELGLYRRASGIVIINPAEKTVLCQQRSASKDERPNVWIAMFGGKARPNELGVEGALRELNEELNVDPNDCKLEYYDLVKAEDRKQFEYLYYVFLNDQRDFTFDPVEVQQIRWLDIKTVIQSLKNDPKWYSYGYDIDMLAKFS
jgi:8-oxo-dGTP pyrophosphatase MutT (NUDIX family)